MNSRMGCAFWTVAVILERLSITSRSSLIMESLISSTQRVRALTHRGPAHRLTTPISRHLITCNDSILMLYSVWIFCKIFIWLLVDFFLLFTVRVVILANLLSKRLSLPIHYVTTSPTYYFLKVNKQNAFLVFISIMQLRM